MAKRFTLIRDRIADKIEALSGADFQVFKYPTQQFDRFPAVVIVPEEGDSEWETNTLDERNYPFDVKIYYDTKNTGKETALDNLMNLVDDILDTFATDRQLSDDSPTLQAALASAGYTNDVVAQVKPVAAGWGEVAEREMLVATIKITVELKVPNQ